ncbi:Photosystem I assembly protein Ycf3 [anaerobic digester metagenome]
MGEKASKTYSKGKEFFNNGEIEKALEKFEEAHNKNPHNPQYLYALGITHDLLGDPELSLKYMDKVLLEDPNHIQSKIHKIIELDTLGKSFEAMELVEASIKIHRNGIFNALQAVLLMDMNRPKSQVNKCLGNALKINDKEPYIWFLKGIVESYYLKWDQALNSYNRAISGSKISFLDDDVFVTKNAILSEKLTLYLNINQLNKALECTNELLKLNPNDVIVLYDKSRIYYLLGEYDNSLIVLQKALNIDPDNILCLNLKGVIYDVKGSPKTALRIYERVSELEPDYEDTISNISILYFFKREYEKALDVAKKALKVNPKSSYGLYWGSRAARKLENLPLARDYEKRLNDPDVDKVFLEKNLQEKIVNDQWRMKNCGYNFKLIEREFKLKDRPGRLDLLYENMDNGDYVVVELKMVIASEDTYEQIDDYMDSISKTIGHNRKVKGLVIGTGQDKLFKKLLKKNKDMLYLDYYRLGLG